MPEELMEMEATDLGENDQQDTQDEGVDDGGDVDEESQQDEQDDTDEEGEESEEPEGEQEEQQQQSAAQDGRTLPGPLKAAISAVKQSNPEGAKMIRATYFENQQFKQNFATPAEAATIKATLEEIGGTEGIQQIQQEREEWAEVDRAVEEGRAAELLKDNPELLTKNAVGVVNEWAKTAPEQYGYYQNLVAANKMESLGLQGGLAQLHAYFKDTPPEQWDPKGILGFIGGLHDKIVDVREQAAQYEQKRTDPAKEQLERDRAQFEDQRRADFEGQVASEAETYLSGAVDKAIDTLLNGRKVDDDARAIFRKEVTSEVWKKLGATQGFERQLEALYRTGDRAKSVAWIKQQYDRILGPGKAADVIAPLLRNINPQRTTTQGNKPAQKETQRSSSEPGVVNLREMPDWDQVNWSKTTTADYAMGKAVLTNGKQARW